jgi:SWI/SNF-related matrix-associated actin-dependent regulator 1 of chromatin subfamily A
VEYVERNRRVLIGDQMGLGKTIESLASVHHLDAYPCLVVCPASLKYNWEKEWNTWLPRKTVKVQEAGEGLDLRSRVTVINYDILWRHREELRERGFKGLILDESHYVKNGSAKRSKAARQIAKRVPEDGTVILLSGTAVMNRPKDLVHQLKVLDVFKQEFGTWHGFARRFCEGKQTRWGFKADGASNTKELHERLVKTCYVRRNKEEVLTELPDKQRKYLEFEIDNRKEYDQAERDIVSYVQKEAVTDEEFLASIEHLDEHLQNARKREKARKAGRAAEMAETLMKIMNLKKLAARGKMGDVKAWIDDFLEEDVGPLVVFAWHREIVNEIADHYDAPRIMGDVKASDRQRIVEEFQAGDHDLIVLNIQAGGTGLTLTESSNLAFVELPWTWSEVEQAEDRIHRIGQENAANIYFLLGQNTIDADVFTMLEGKRVVAEQVNAGRDITDDEGNIVQGVIQKLRDRVSE